jgi:protein ImuA
MVRPPPSCCFFTAGIAVPDTRQGILCVTRTDRFAPALFQKGLKSDRVVYLKGGNERTVLTCFEEGLRHAGLGPAVLPMIASRRLQCSGTTPSPYVALQKTEAADFAQPTAATTRCSYWVGRDRGQRTAGSA